MDSEKLISYIQSPIDLDIEDFKAIEELLVKYPYFHSANMLYVKAAHNTKNETLNDIVNKVSASIPNRELLHDLIMLTKKDSASDFDKNEREEESDARKEIRDRINQRRKVRQIQKGEILLDSGGSWHQMIVKNFFSPMIENLINSLNNTNDYSENVNDTNRSVNQKLNTGNLTDADKQREEREKRRAERMQRRDERILQKADETIDNTQNSEISIESDVKITAEIDEEERERRRAARMLEREKRFEEKLKEKSEHKLKTEVTDNIDDIIITSEQIIEENILPEVEKNVENNEIENTGIVETGIKSSSDEIEIVSDINDLKLPQKEIYSKEKLIVEDFQVNQINDSNENNALDDIYDKIISSKRVTSLSKQPYNFIEIQEDITGLPDKKNIIATDISNDQKIEPDTKIENIDSGIKNLEFESGISYKKPDNEIEFLIEDKNNTEEVQISDKNQDIRIIDEKSFKASEEDFEFIEKKEDIQPDNSFETSDVKVEETNSEKKVESIEKIENQKEFLINDIPEESVQSETTKVVEQTIQTDESVHDSSNEIVIETDTKAANDVFARIAAFKKKKESEEIQKKINPDALIDKFVKETPSIKKIEPIESDHIDLSEESIKEKKPVITELMASIYINQGKFDNAIEVYEKLILKNPEKKDYFASKIEELNNLKG